MTYKNFNKINDLLWVYSVYKLCTRCSGRWGSKFCR